MKTNVIVIILLVALVAIGGVMLKNQSDEKKDRDYKSNVEKDKEMDRVIRSIVPK